MSEKNLNPTVTITNLFVSPEGENRIRYTVLVPHKNGSILTHGDAGFDEPIIVPLSDLKK